MQKSTFQNTRFWNLRAFQKRESVRLMCDLCRFLRELNTTQFSALRRSTVSRLHVVHRSSPSANLTYPRDNFHCFSVRLWTLFCRKLDGFGVLRVPQKCSVLLRKKQARSTQGARIASENKSLMKQEIVPQGAYLLLFCAARFFLLPFRSC